MDVLVKYHYWDVMVLCNSYKLQIKHSRCRKFIRRHSTCLPVSANILTPLYLINKFDNVMFILHIVLNKVLDIIYLLYVYIYLYNII